MILDPNRLPDREISKITGHSLTAIQVKRSKLKKEMAEVELDMKENKNEPKDIEENNLFSITHHFIAQIVKEEDEHTMKVIEDYVREKQSQGELVSSTVIPEGKLRHIINLGLCLYNTQNKSKLNAANLFPETMYVEYLRKELEKAWGENQKLRNQIYYMESGIEVIDLSNQE